MASKRLLSVDVLRGMTICLMIIVNNGVGEAWPFLEHAKWNGLTPCDLVFPFFLFLMGASIYLAFSGSGFKADKKAYLKIVKRTVGIVAVCYTIFWLARMLEGNWLPFATFRLTGVLPRIAMAYFFTAMLAVSVDHKWMLPSAIGLLVLYSAILLLGNGYANDASNILVRVDKAILGEAHLYKWDPVDPEGLLGIIPSVAHAMLGFLCGKILRSSDEIGTQALKLAERGVVMLAIGMAVSIFLPLNKRIWSPSFVLVTCGLAALLLALLIYVLDMKKMTGWCGFFKVFGMNSLALYALSELLAVIHWYFNLGGKAYEALMGIGFPAGLASFTFAFCFMLIVWSVGCILYRKKIFIKL